MSGPFRSTPSCGDRAAILRLAALRARDEIDPSGERLLRIHLAACPGCFERAVAIDPALLFLRLTASAEADETRAPAAQATRSARGHRQEPPEAELLAAEVLAAIRVRATEESRHPTRVGSYSGHSGHWRPWLRAAAVVLLAVGLGAVLVFRRPSAPDLTADKASLAAAPGTPSRPLIEELGSPGARVYEFAASTPQEPTVVFVANPDADL